MSGGIGEQGSCTTCTFSKDFSNYWTAISFFKHQNGSYKLVPLMENDALPSDISGGMTIYYTQQDFNSNGNKIIIAFKPGFCMTVGRVTTSTLKAAKERAGLRFICLDKRDTRFPELPEFPTKPCKGGIMTVHHFPLCWNGKNLDSPDHQSHIYDTTKEVFTVAGPCPDSHPVRMSQLAYETQWNTTQFNSILACWRLGPFRLKL